MEMPDAVKWLLPIVVGESWPEGDEDKLRELRDAWHNASKAIQPIADTATKGATEVLGGWTGEGAEKFAEAWKKFVEGDEAYFKSLADSSKALGDSCNATALDVEYTKYMIIISLVILAAQIVAMIAAAAVTFGGSTAGIAPAQIATRMTVQMIFRQLMQKLAQEGFKKVAKELLEKLLKEGLKKIGKEVLQNTAMNLAMDAGIQGLQMAKGDRDSWDFSKTKDSAISGAVDGVVGAGSSSIGKGATKGLSDSVGGQIVDSAARGAVRGAAEGVASTVGQAAVTGDLDKLSTKDVLMGASGGAVGGGVDGAKSQIGDIKAANAPSATPDVDGPSTPDGDSGTPSRTPSTSDSSSRPDSSSPEPAARSTSDSEAPQSRSDGGNQDSQRPTSSSESGPQRTADSDRVSQSSTQAPERPADAPASTGERAAQPHQNAPAAAADNGAGSGQQQAAAANQQQAPAAQHQAPAASPAQTPAASSAPSPSQTPASSPSSAGSPAPGPSQGPTSSPSPGPSQGPAPGPSPSPSQSSAMPPAASSGAPASTGAPSNSGGYGMASNTGSSAPSGGYGMAPGGNPPGNGPAPGGFPPPGGHDPSRPFRPNDGVQAAGLTGNGGPQQPRFDQPPAPMPFQGQQPMQPPPPGGFAPPPPPPPGGGGGPMPPRGPQGQPGPMGPRPTGPQPPQQHPGQGGHPQDRGPRQRPQQPPPGPQGPPRPPQGYQGRPGPGQHGGVPPRPQTPPPGPPPGNRGPAGYPPPPPRPQHPGNGPFPGNRGPMPPPPPPGHHPGRPMPPGAEPPRFGGPQRPPQVPAPRPGQDGYAGPPQDRTRPPQQQQPPARPVEHAQQQPPQDRGAALPKDAELPKDVEAPKDTHAPKDTETPKEVETPKDTDAPKDTDTPHDTEAPQDVTPDDRTTVDEPYLTDPDFHTDDPAAYRALAETQIDKRGFDKDTGEARSEQVRREGLAKRDAHEDPRVKEMSDQGAYAVHSYTRTDMAERITHAQRHGGAELDALRPHIEAITSGLNEMPAYEGLVSRRVNFGGNESAIRGFLEAHAKGQVIVDPQMLSTSRVTPDHPRSNFPGEVEMRIQSKTGRHIEDLASKKDEREVLMKSATQLRVTDVKMGPGHPEHPGYKKRLDDGSPNDLPKWIVECEEVVAGEDGHLSPDEVHQKVAERRDYNNAEQERLEAEAAEQEAQLRRDHPELFQHQGFDAFETKLADGKGGWVDAADAPVRETPKPPREHAPDGGWSELAKPLEEGGTPVIHAGSTETPHQQVRLIMDELPAIGEANTRNYYAPESWKDGYQTNSAEALVAFENRMDGGDAVAAPSTGGSPLQHVSDRLGGQWSDRNGFADVARELGERPIGARTAVAFEHHAAADPNAPEGSPRAKDRIETRIVAAVNTPHGVVFADPMTGRLATLPDDPTSIKAMPMGGGDAPHVHQAEVPETAHTEPHTDKTEVDIAERLKGPEETPARLDESYLGDENFRGTPEDHKSLRDRYDNADLAEQAREKALRRLEASPLKDRVSPEAAEAIYSYSREHAYAINEANRRGESHPDFENAQRSTRAIVGALNELPDFHGEAIRGIDTKGDMQAAGMMAAHYEPGQTVPEPTMTSSTIKTSPDTKSKFGQDVEIHIVSKTGKDVSSLAENPGEHEAINKPATQLYVHSKEFKTPPLVDRPKWVIHAEEVTPGDPRYLDPETAKQKMDERRARHAAEAPELARLAQAQSMARLGGFDEPQTPHLTAENPAEHGVADADKGSEYGEQAQDHSATDDTAELPTPERDYSSMAVATNPPSEPAIHAGSASPEQQAAYVADRHPRLGEVNPHFNDPDALANGYRSNCTRTPGAYMDQLNGIDSTAGPLLPHEMDSRGTLEHVEERFGGRFSDRADYDTVIREMRGMPTDHHAVIAVKYLDENGVERGHVAMVANTRDGVAFLDPQSGALMNLPHPPLSMKLMHVGVPEGPAAQHTDGHTTPTETSSTRPVDPRIAYAMENTPDVPPSRIGPDGRPIVDAGYGMAHDEPARNDRADGERFLNDPEVAAAVDGLDPDKKRAVHEDENGVKHDVGPMRDFIREHLPAHPELVRLMEHPDNAYLRASLLNNPMTIGSLLLHPEAIPILEDALRDVEERGYQMIDDVQEAGPGDTPLTQEQREVSEAAARLAAESDPEHRVHSGFSPEHIGDPAKIDEFLAAERAAWPQNQGDLNRIAERIASENDGHAGSRQTPKDDDRARAKIAKYEGDASLLTDLVGAKIQFDTLADVYNALGAVIADPGLEIVSFDDRFANPQDSGYRDLQMNVRLPNGHVAELRLHLTHIDTVSAYEHALYEVRRDFPTYNLTLDENNKKRLSPEQALLDAALMDRVREKFMAGLREGLPPEENT
ncbi:toxin glutamine deamidase domain-containing protein [Amycolatopsis sp. NPDC102389]|uniref:WXG100-like domain-containing protein n=1 Tax=Amycolatopsis sp. NPDC102389 TaxID=3363941 RepID=UPI0037F78EED